MLPSSTSIIASSSIKSIDSVTPPDRSTKAAVTLPPSSASYEPWSLAYAFSRSETHSSFGSFAFCAKMSARSASLLHGSHVSTVTSTQLPNLYRRKVAKPSWRSASLDLSSLRMCDAPLSSLRFATDDIAPSR